MISGQYSSSESSSAPLTPEDRKRYMESIYHILNNMMPNSTKQETDEYGNVKSVLNLPTYQAPQYTNYQDYLVPRNRVTQATK